MPSLRVNTLIFVHSAVSRPPSLTLTLCHQSRHLQADAASTLSSGIANENLAPRGTARVMLPLYMHTYAFLMEFCLKKKRMMSQREVHIDLFSQFGIAWSAAEAVPFVSSGSARGPRLLPRAMTCLTLTSTSCFDGTLAWSSTYPHLAHFPQRLRDAKRPL
jgi:hypothetical protein